MSERKVNLRVSAVGGEKLKAELRSIGKEGQHALTLIEGGAPAASRGLTATGAAADELMNRLSRLSLQAAQAAANMNTMGRAGSGVQARINAMTGVSGGTARDAADIEAYGQALDDLRAKFNPLFSEMRRHKEAVSEIDDAWRVGAITLDEWVSATRREEAANASAAASIRQKQAAFENFVNTGLRDAIDALNGVTGSLARTSEDMDAFGRAMDDARAKFSPLYSETRRHNEAMEEMRRLYTAGILTEKEFEAATQSEVAAHAKATAAIRERQAALANMVNTALRSTIDANTGVSALPARSAEDIAAYGRALDETRAKYNPMFAAIQKYRSELAQLKAAHAAGAVSADEYSAALSRLRQASLNEIGIIKGRVQGYQQMAKQGGLARFQMIQLGYQLNDIGVSLASGQNPFVVMVQQGAQIAQIYGGQGGVRAMFQQIGGLVTKIPGPVQAVGVAAAAAALGIAGIQHEINKVSDVTVTFGDTALAVWQVISEGIWDWIKPAVDAIAPWFDDAWDLVIASTKLVGNTLVNTFRTVVGFVGTVPEIIGEEFERIVRIGKAAYDGVIGVWNALPGAIGDFAYQAVNAFISGIEWMLQKLVDGINAFIEGLNSALSLLPDWATPDGGLKLQTIGDVSLGRANNPYAGGGSAAGDALDQAISDIAAAAAGDNDAWNEFLNEAGSIWDSDPMGEFFDSVSKRAQQNAKDRLAKDKKGGKGGGGKSEKDEVGELVKSLEQELVVLRETDPIKKKMMEYSKQLAGATDEEKAAVLALVIELDRAKNGFEAIPRALATYAEEAKRFGDDIGEALVGAFDGATDALVEFITTGKLSFSDLATSIISDLARIAIRAYIMGPLAGALGNALGGTVGEALAGAFVNHEGGMAGSGPVRVISAANFVTAPRLHSGTGPVSGLRSDEYAAILQRGERVLNRRETAAYDGGGSPTVINFNGVRDAKSFRQSRTQIASDLGRAVSMGRRGI